MDSKLIHTFEPALRSFQGNASDPELLLGASGPLTAYYAPFDAINPSARVVLIGITPGRAQAEAALGEARRQLLSGASLEQARDRAKALGAFAGAMRSNLTAMLDRIGLAGYLGIGSCAALFGDARHLMQTTSVLPFPVFVDGENYNGKPDIITSPFLTELMVKHFVPIVQAVEKAVLVPLGPVPSKAIDWLVKTGRIDERRVLRGLPHPSGANAERIQYFLGKKPRHELSAKTDPVKLDAAFAELVRAIKALR